jgi:hypothetical protein
MKNLEASTGNWKFHTRSGQKHEHLLVEGAFASWEA